jgi:AAA family ATP:ADP antiporter
VPDRQPSSGAAAAAGEPHQNAFAMVWRTRYLRYMALMVLLLATVDATGEYVLGSIVKDAAVRYVADGRAPGLDVAQVIAVFYSRYFGLVNVLSLVLQLFFVSRIIRHFGIPVAVAMLPALSCIAYTVLAFVPSLWFVLGAKVAEKGSNYSLSATVQNILYLSCTRAEKYSAKQTIDAFCYRLGDVVSAALVFVGGAVGLRASGFAKANILLAVLWLAVSVVVGRRYVRRQTSTLPPPEVAGHRASRLDATPGR